MFGLKSDIEKSDPTACMTNFFKEVFRGDLTCEPAVEIAQSRSGAQLETQTYDCKHAEISDERDNLETGKKQERGDVSRHASENISRSDT